MKEAAGEANLTVVAIILIAVVVAVATPLVNSLMKTSSFRACCTDSGGVWKNNQCEKATNSSDYNQTQCKKCISDAGGSAEDQNKCTAAS